MEYGKKVSMELEKYEAYKTNEYNAYLNALISTYGK